MALKHAQASPQTVRPEMAGMQFTILNDRRFWLLFAFGTTLLGFPYGILTDWITRSGDVYSTNHPGGGDFVVFYVASELILQGHIRDLYDPATFSQTIIDRYGSDYEMRWLYPPHFLFFIAPIAKLPYLAAWAGFMAASFAFLAAIGRIVWGKRDIVFWLLVAPSTFLGVLLGQMCFLVGGLLIGSIFLWDRKPILAGILLGLLTIKPQYGVLIPLVLLLEGRWRVIFVASVTALVMIGVSVLVFGTAPWQAFLFGMDGANSDILTTASKKFLGLQMSVFGSARLLGADLATAAWLQGLSALFAVVALVATTLSGAQRDTKIAMLVTATYLVSPYVLFYDLVASTFVALWLYFGKEREEPPNVLFSMLLIFVACLSFVNGATVAIGFGSGPIAFLALAIALLLRARAETGRNGQPLQASPIEGTCREVNAA
ncbi:hypothetical protein J2R99_001092 [Rhodopseudomonas julia]|uniref:DUF2029 domain-containing protein n=1 Tax=Rhodopseudomonas julia TaxID=200617 RepID=A0ABU0C413_9BRAD|nr:glycosyltransferase family 87 protein [Rhodopseudomonas julia]MDQ0325243.1 hypothetical protein [Rhodopseudomonas julia]